MLAQMQGGAGGGAPAGDAPLPDTAEKIQISSLSLLKMLKHGKLICFFLSIRFELFSLPHLLFIYKNPLSVKKNANHSMLYFLRNCTGRAGIPMEVMGLMLGQFVDDYTITCVDVFAMPQHGTGVSVEAVDPVFQTKMLDMLKQTGRAEMVVGWYHSHPGFGCWLSGVDMNTQTSFEQLNQRAVSS